jgi:hypothetical protein
MSNTLHHQQVLCHSNRHRMDDVHIHADDCTASDSKGKHLLTGVGPIICRTLDSLHQSSFSASPMYMTSLIHWWTSFVEHRPIFGWWSADIHWPTLTPWWPSDSKFTGRRSVMHQSIVERCDDVLPMRSDVGHRWRHSWFLTTVNLLQMTPDLFDLCPQSPSEYLKVSGRQPHHFYQKTHRLPIVAPG